jgi:NAD(P)-dependent dehydrogenase (short-subunit alcohol dehydrogenase family)
MAHVYAARALLPRWLAGGQGRMLVTASAAGLLTMLGGPAYPVTKHGAVAFAEWLRATDPDRWLRGMNRLQRDGVDPLPGPDLL